VKYLSILLFVLILSSCANNTYYDQYGGKPLTDKVFIVSEQSPLIKLKLIFRRPNTNLNPDRNALNVMAKVIIDDRQPLNFQVSGIVLESLDSSYLYTYSDPQLYSIYNDYPLLSKSSDVNSGKGHTERPCIFTITRKVSEYKVTLRYKLISPDGSTQDLDSAFIFNLRDFVLPNVPVDTE
jgi:hypothetical protein